MRRHIYVHSSDVNNMRNLIGLKDFRSCSEHFFDVYLHENMKLSFG